MCRIKCLGEKHCVQRPVGLWGGGDGKGSRVSLWKLLLPHVPLGGKRVTQEAPLLVYFSCSACKTFSGCREDEHVTMGKHDFISDATETGETQSKESPQILIVSS